MRRALAALALVALAGCAAEVPLNSPVGTWRGDELPGRPETDYIRRIAADGTFVVEYCSGGRLHAERGRWSFGSGVLNLATDAVDGAAVRAEESYTTDSFDGTEWDTTLTASNTLPDAVDDSFTAHRIGDAIQFTGC